MRRLTRTMLMNLGAKSVMEAGDGLAALEAIRTGDPDVMFLDWDMPILNGMEVMRIVRSPGVFRSYSFEFYPLPQPFFN